MRACARTQAAEPIQQQTAECRACATLPLFAVRSMDQVIAENSGGLTEGPGGVWRLEGPELELNAYRGAAQGETSPARWFFGDCQGDLILFVKDDPSAEKMLVAIRAELKKGTGSARSCTFDRRKPLLLAVPVPFFSRLLARRERKFGRLPRREHRAPLPASSSGRNASLASPPASAKCSCKVTLVRLSSYRPCPKHGLLAKSPASALAAALWWTSSGATRRSLGTGSPRHNRARSHSASMASSSG